MRSPLTNSPYQQHCAKGKGSSRSTGRASVMPDMTPMIDVVFLLIIFFLVSSHLARREARPQLPLPQAVSSQPELVAENQNTLVLTIASESELQIEGQNVTIDTLRKQLQQRTSAAVQAGAAFPRVRLRAARTLRYESVEAILATCAAAGVTDVRLAVQHVDAL